MKKENNELIAEFMNVDQVDIDTFLEENGELKYHSSWDWLMRVVDKLESEIGAEVTIKRMQCEIAYKDPLNKDKNVKFTMASGIKINAVNAAILNFIDWYNENK